MATFPSDLSGSAPGGADPPDRPGARSGHAIKHAFRSLLNIDRKKLLENAKALMPRPGSSSKQPVIEHAALRGPAPHPLPDLTPHLKAYPRIARFIEEITRHHDTVQLALLEQLGEMSGGIQLNALDSTHDDHHALLAQALMAQTSFSSQVDTCAKEVVSSVKRHFMYDYIGADDVRHLVSSSFGDSANQYGYSDDPTQAASFARWIGRLLTGATQVSPMGLDHDCSQIAMHMLRSARPRIRERALQHLTVPTPPLPPPSLAVIPDEHVQLCAFFQQAIDRGDTALVILLQDLQMLPENERTVMLDAAGDRVDRLLAHLLARTPGFRNRVHAGKVTLSDCRAYAQQCFNTSTTMGEHTAVMSTWCDNVAIELRLLALTREETGPTPMLPGSRGRAT